MSKLNDYRLNTARNKVSDLSSITSRNDNASPQLVKSKMLR